MNSVVSLGSKFFILQICALLIYSCDNIIISKYITIDNSVDDVYIRKVLPEKMKYNLKYIKELGIGKDLMLCIKTIL